jgi:hypothetical protein
MTWDRAAITVKRTAWHAAVPLAIISIAVLASPSLAPDDPFGLRWKPAVFLVALVALAAAALTLVVVPLDGRPAAQRFAVALVGWTFVGAMWLLGVFDPVPIGDVLLPCGRLVGHSAACDAAQTTISAAYWDDHVKPVLVAFGAGYLAIVVLGLLGLVRRSINGAHGQEAGWDEPDARRAM